MGVGFCFSLAFAPGVRGWALECSDRVPRAALRLSSGGSRRLPRVRQWPVGSQGRGGSGREVPSSSGVAGSIRVAPTAAGSAVVGVPPRRGSEVAVSLLLVPVGWEVGYPICSRPARTNSEIGSGLVRPSADVTRVSRGYAVSATARASSARMICWRPRWGSFQRAMTLEGP